MAGFIGRCRSKEKPPCPGSTRWLPLPKARASSRGNRAGALRCVHVTVAMLTQGRVPRRHARNGGAGEEVCLSKRAASEARDPLPNVDKTRGEVVVRSVGKVGVSLPVGAAMGGHATTDISELWRCPEQPGLN